MFGIYIHWPFCQSICPYCDFNRIVSDRDDEELFIEAIILELNFWLNETKKHPVSSVFFGGGTPSLMRPDSLHRILEHIKRCWGFSKNPEITLEMNPTSIEMTKAQAFADAGINRASVGVQSLRPKTLDFLGRKHTVAEAQKALQIIGTVFDRFSFDLIYAHRFHENPKEWALELTDAVALARNHISLYQLTYCPQTPFGKQLKRGTHRELSPDQCANLYQISEDILSKHGFLSYEVSNYARMGDVCLHNMIYWKGHDYIGIGPGAHGRLTVERGRQSLENLSSVYGWLNSVQTIGHGLAQRIFLTDRQILQERLLMGLRLDSGIGLDFSLQDPILMDRLIFLEKEGFLELSEENVRATTSGRLLLDSVLAYIFRIDDVKTC